MGLTYGNIAFAPVNCFGSDILYSRDTSRQSFKRNLFSFGLFDETFSEEIAHEKLLYFLKNYNQEVIEKSKNAFSRNQQIAQYVSKYYNENNWIKILDIPFYNHCRVNNPKTLKIAIDCAMQQKEEYARKLIDASNFNVDVFTLYSNNEIKNKYIDYMVQALQKLSCKQSKLVVFSSKNIETNNKFVDIVKIENDIYHRSIVPEQIKNKFSRSCSWFICKEDQKRIADYFNSKLEDITPSYFGLF